MIVNDLYVLGSLGRPHKANAPLVIDPNAALPLSVSSQGFELIPRRDAQVFQDRRPIKLFQLPQRRPLHIDPSEHPLALEQGFGFLALEAFDRHGLIVTFGVNNVKRVYLDVAEDMAQRKIPMTMLDWETRLNGFIEATDREVLQDAGKVTFSGVSWPLPIVKWS